MNGNRVLVLGLCLEWTCDLGVDLRGGDLGLGLEPNVWLNVGEGLDLGCGRSLLELDSDLGMDLRRGLDLCVRHLLQLPEVLDLNLGPDRRLVLGLQRGHRGSDR